MAEKPEWKLASATPPLFAGTTLQWDGSSSMFQDAAPYLFSSPGAAVCLSGASDRWQ